MIMGRIKVLDESIASKIAAGEVIERPASVVKELIENSIDAGATFISVNIAEGGKRLIKVSDNGEGISREDAPVAFLRHSTSKISKEEDLLGIRTMGFRGEALYSIASVAKVALKSKKRGELSGTLVEIEGGGRPAVSEDGCPEGTSIEVKDLFYNMPARLKFLRSPESEAAKVLEVFRSIAIANPAVRFRYVHGAGRAMESPAGDLKGRIAGLFGDEVSKDLLKIETPNVTGYIGTHELSFPTSKNIYLFVNSRWVRDKGINRAIIDGYGPIVGEQRYPFAVLDIKIHPEDVDVNIHPTKSEVRFKSPRYVYDAVKGAVREALASRRPIGPERAISYSKTGLPSTGPFKSPAAGESIDFYGETTGREEPRLEFTAEDGEIRTPELSGLNFVGQLWGEFLVAQSDGVFYIIDQHGAAERIAFERLKKEFYGGGVKKQLLLIPERFESTGEEKEAIIALTDYLDRLGFEVSDFGPSARTGGNSFLIKSVPHLISARPSAGLIKDIAEEAAATGGSARAERDIEAVLMTIACHSVIRGARALTREEGMALLREMARIDFAAHCPHGRPVIKKITREELEMMFKR